MTVCFDESGNVIEPEGVCADYDTGSAWPSFAIVKPAIDNTRVDMSPYGQSCSPTRWTRCRRWTWRSTR